MFCTNCGKELPDGTAFCTECGQKQESVQAGSPTTPYLKPPSNQPPRAPQQFSYQQQPHYAQSQPRAESKSTTGIIVAAILCSGAIAALIIGAVLFMLSEKNNSENNQEQITSTEKSQDDTKKDTSSESNSKKDTSSNSDSGSGSDSKKDSSSDSGKTDTSSISAEVNPDAVDSSYAYILPNASTRLLGESDLEGLSNYELALARNEIYARHGYEFSKDIFRNYFSKKTWYNPRYDATEWDARGGNEAFLNSIERANSATIAAIEKKHNSPYAS